MTTTPDTTTPGTTAPAGPQIDIRGPRFSAWITTTVLVIVLAMSTVSTTAAAVVLGLQGVAFALGAFIGPGASPYGRIFARFIAPRLSPATEREPVAPVRFAQLVGLIFAVVGTVGFATDLTPLGFVATGFALFAAFLNAAFDFCLGCKMYPLVARLRRSN